MYPAGDRFSAASSSRVFGPSAHYLNQAKRLTGANAATEYSGAMKTALLVLPTLTLGAMLLGGCQTSHISRSSVHSLAGSVTPRDTILVKKFDASKAVFKGDNSGVNVLNDADRERVTGIISQVTIEELCRYGYAAKAFSGDIPPGSVVVEGAVIQVDKGSYSKRLLIGMGAGSQSMTAHVRICRVDTPEQVLAELDLTGSGGFFGSSGGMWANMDWIAIYSASLGDKVAAFIAGKVTK